MKKLKLNCLLISSMLTVSSITGIPEFGLGQTTSPTGTSVKFQKEKSEISQDMANIQMSRDRIKSIELRCKKDKSSNNESAQILDKKELRKEKANLKLAKSYLKAAKMALIDKHNAVIEELKKEIRKDEKELTALRKKLNKDLEKGDEEAASKDATMLARYQNELNNDIENLHGERIDRNNDILAVNEEIEKSNGEFTGLLVAENVVAKSRNMREK